MTEQLKLFHYWRSSCSWRVRWALNLKKIPFDSRPVNLLKGEQSTASYAKINPSNFVPGLDIEGQTFGESMAIIEWIDEKWPNNPLLPQDPFSRLKVRQLYMTISSGTQPLQNLIAQKYFSDDVLQRKEYAQHWINRGFRTFENLLSKSGSGTGTFCYGSQVSMADLCLVPQVYNAKRFNVNLDEFPMISRIYRQCLTTDACIAASPEKQADAV